MTQSETRQGLRAGMSLFTVSNGPSWKGISDVYTNGWVMPPSSRVNHFLNSSATRPTMALSAPRRASRRHFQRDTPISTVLFSSSGGGKKKIYSRHPASRQNTGEDRVPRQFNDTIKDAIFSHFAVWKKYTGEKKGTTCVPRRRSSRENLEFVDLWNLSL